MKEPAAFEPPYRRIVAEIKRRIEGGDLRPGARVPSARQITRDWGVAIATATKALAALRQEGLVKAVPGVGTVVAEASAAGRGPRRKPHGAESEISRERIVRAAVAIADQEGLAALSMRRVASELGTATMSLYQHVGSKEELSQHMVEAAVSEIMFPDPPPRAWRARLELAARLQWSIYRRHPWLAPLISFTRPLVGFALLAQAEWILAALDGAGLDANTMMYIQLTLSNYVRGTAVNIEEEFQFERDTGLSEKQWMATAEADAAVTRVLDSHALPQFSHVFASEELSVNLDTLFEFGLERVLDGIGAMIDPRPL